MILREAVEADLPAILAIHNEAILHSLAIWQYEPAPLANRQAWFAERASKGQPILIAEIDGALAGYASYGDFRAGAGYSGTVEDSIYVRGDMQRRGVARALMGALIDHARGAGKHVMIGAIGLPNEASVALHASFGFVETGRLSEIGRKNGMWLDLLMMQKRL
ncbi:MAG: N-acetyltransferase [Methylobacteriaceae bacterium]|nr:N-acetyltransferase [Methylobacteriaceae bacterium]